MPKNKITKKSNNDKFYTNPSVAKSLLLLFLKYRYKYPHISIDYLIEPSAGDSAFFKHFKNSGLGFDLDPPNTYEESSVIKSDWLSVNEKDLLGGDFAIIGNPPFGERNKLTKDFIKHAQDMQYQSGSCKCIAFVLPQVFDKLTMQRVFPKEWKLVYKCDLPHNAFLLEGEQYHVPCVFQVWMRDTENLIPDKENLREVEVDLDNEYFSYVNSKQDPDFFVFGAAPHKVILPNEVLPNNRGYYIKCKKSVDTVKEIFQNIDWKLIGKSSVNGGVFWLNKGEIVKQFKVR